MSFSTFSPDDILRGNTFRGRMLTDEELSSLAEQAKTFASSTLWKILKAELEWYAVKTLMEQGHDENDIRAARVFGNIVNVVDNKLKQMGK